MTATVKVCETFSVWFPRATVPRVIVKFCPEVPAFTVPEKVTRVEAELLFTVKVPAGIVCDATAETVVFTVPVSVMAADPREPSLIVARFPETLRVPELIRQLAAQPEKA